MWFCFVVGRAQRNGESSAPRPAPGPVETEHRLRCPRSVPAPTPPARARRRGPLHEGHLLRRSQPAAQEVPDQKSHEVSTPSATAA